MTQTLDPVAGRNAPSPRRGPASAGPPGGGGARTTGAALIGTVSLCAAIAAATLVPDTLDRFGVGIALTGVVLGIPHGSVDHMVPFWATGARPTARALAQGLSSYLLVAALAATAMIVFPVPVVVAFLVVSALHFGRGEVTFAAARAGRPVPGRWTDLPLTVVHGAVVVLLPLSLWHERAAPVLGALAPALARPVPSWVLDTATVTVVLGVAAVVGLLLARGRGRDAAELLLVLAVFALVPPLVAFGVYFGGWHAVRHTGRLLALPGPAGPLTFGAALRRYVVHAAGPTVVALAALLIAQRTVSAGAVPVALAVLLALTFPHLRTVAAMDRAVAAGGRSDLRVSGPGTPRPAPGRRLHLATLRRG